MTELPYETDIACPNCRAQEMHVFHKINNVPVHSVLLIPTYEEALNFPRGDIELGFCKTCGFVSNLRFDASLHNYSEKYEETQGFSQTFNKFQKNLVDDLIQRYQLYDKDIIEIGCGKGEFLSLLCEAGNNRGVGFDPAYIEERNESNVKDKITFIRDFYSEKYIDYHGDFVACKMTLEHIPNTAEFVEMVRHSIGDRFNTVVFFQIPNAEYVFGDLAFWDIYYEHCSYFSKGSLSYLFRQAGFDILQTYTGYDDQYLMIEAKPSTISNNSINEKATDVHQMEQLIHNFMQKYHEKVSEWQFRLKEFRDSNKKVVLWGSGSKGVSFLTTLGIEKEIEYGIDINPYKKHTFMAGSGQKIEVPEFLRSYEPDSVIIMNPVYVDEIKEDLIDMGLNPEILTV